MATWWFKSEWRKEAIMPIEVKERRITSLSGRPGFLEAVFAIISHDDGTPQTPLDKIVLNFHHVLRQHEMGYMHAWEFSSSSVQIALHTPIPKPAIRRHVFVSMPKAETHHVNIDNAATVKRMEEEGMQLRGEWMKNVFGPAFIENWERSRIYTIQAMEPALTHRQIHALAQTVRRYTDKIRCATLPPEAK
jgi:hypothetical protein